jgi:hypothetical protein
MYCATATCASFLDYVIHLHNNEVNYIIIIITSSSQTVRSYALIFCTYVSWVNMMKMV